MKKIMGFSVIVFVVLVGCFLIFIMILFIVNSSFIFDFLVVSLNDVWEYKILKLDNEIDVILILDLSVEKLVVVFSVGVGLLYDFML